MVKRISESLSISENTTRLKAMTRLISETVQISESTIKNVMEGLVIAGRNRVTRTFRRGKTARLFNRSRIARIFKRNKSAKGAGN